ncbi:MAG: UDP-N-acetylmuramoyl-tripeptide--D-alanyl-D-alanine ligase [Acidobacteria bacterium]|nr:UDP-N-acetylmuramoyl-tripeptide--D-alanyl-D-alanine ligase [Acidobacteriota bacterium]
MLELGCAPDVEQRQVTGWSVDSRTIQPGDLFVALRGPHHDGHAHVGTAFEKGAVAAMVSSAVDAAGPLLVVDDTQAALERLGHEAREAWGGKVIAVTGSAGKTTTKDVIAAMLSVRSDVGKTVGNFNNHVGVPLSILRLPEGCERAVLEMGMNHAGEIAALAGIARPQVGVVTNVGYAHVENFDSIDGIAAAKGELIEGLDAGGVAVLNADDPRVAAMATRHSGRSVTFGMSAGADVRATDVAYSVDGVKFAVRGVWMESRLTGRHSVSNLLTGVAVASLFGIAPEELREAAAALEPGAMRGRHFEKNGILHINDCYNSNPDAARAMIDVLADTPAERRVAVLGEMLELGRWSEQLHRDVGRYAAQSGIDVLVGIRGAARYAVEAAADAGFAASAASFFDEPSEAGDYLRGVLQAGDAVLWKGSRGTRVEVALERFLG